MPEHPLETRITFQGSLVLVKTNVDPSFGLRPEEARRGSITGFSKSSRKRLFKKFASLTRKFGGKSQRPKFVTLTYRIPPNPAEAKRHLQTWWKRVRRDFPGASAIWRMEFQKRGAIHFHLVLFGVKYYDKAELQRDWDDITGQERSFTRIEAIRGFRHLMRYVSKYVAKCDDGGSFAFAGFIPGSYLTGRHWGVFDKEHLPYAEIVEFVVHGRQVYSDFRRGCQKKFGGIRRGGLLLGFFLITDDLESWMRYFNYLVEESFSIRRQKICARTAQRRI